MTMVVVAGTMRKSLEVPISSSETSSAFVARRRQKVFSQQIAVAFRASSDLVEPFSTAAANPDLTWQTTAGAIAGITPFVVAGIEFSKRIIQQRRCKVCGGSGLVKRVGIRVRCNGCGGFLPWESWSRFFSSGR